MAYEKIELPADIFTSNKYKDLQSSSKLVLLILWVECNIMGDTSNGRVVIKQDEIAIKTGLTRRTVNRGISELLTEGLIWNDAGQQSSYGLAIKTDSIAFGSLTKGQMQLLKTLIPKQRCPKGIAKGIHVEHLNLIKDRLMKEDCRCYVCAAYNSLVLHHVSYERYGSELDEDCILLCKRCHYILRKM